MRNRIVTAVKQRFSIRKLSIGAASVLLGTSLYFMGPSAPVVHAATTGAPVVHAATEKEKIDTNDPVVVAGDSTKNDADVNNAIDKYAQGKQEKLQGDHAPLIRPSDTQSVTVNTPGDRAYQVGKIRDKIDYDIKQANEQANKDKESIEKYKIDHPQTLSGQDSDFFKNQGLSVGDEKNSEINQISVDHKDITLSKGQSETIDGIHITHADTDKMTDKERNVMKINSDNKVIIDLQHDQSQGKEITVTYDNLNNSYYLENIDDKTNKIKISKIERTFSHIQEADKIRFTSDGKTPTGADGVYDKCEGPQLIIYNDPSDGFFYNNIKQVSVNDIYYDDKGSQIKFDTKNDKNKAWIFVTSLNSNGVRNDSHNVEKVRAQGLNNSPVNAEKIKGSTVTVTNHNDGWWYSDENNWFNKNPDWDNNAEDNRFGFVGAVAFQYQPGMTLQYWADDSQWGSHWASMQTQVVSSLDQRVIIYDHIKDGTENVTGNDTVTRTIHYLYDNGNTAQPDKTQTVSFNETGTKDDVTGKITWSNDDAQTVNSVITPSITGYTPDKDKVEEQAFKFGDKDVEVTVTYTANTQTAKITYIDDTTETKLDSKDASGKFGQTITFATAPAAEIANYEKQGYVYVSNNFDNQTYQADNKSNSFEVHLKHGKVTVTPNTPQTPNTPINPNDPQSPKYPKDINNTNKDVKRTIDYKYSDGKPAQPTVNDSLHFERTVVIDKVTGDVLSDTWTPSQDFNDVQTPVIQGYKPDRTVVSDTNIGHDHQDIVEHVVYSPDKQFGHIDYIDNDTKTTLTTDTFSGNPNEHENYKPTDRIHEFENKGYEVVSNDYPDGGFNFDDNDQQEQVFHVHLKHGMVTVTTKKPQTPNTPINPDPQSPKYPEDIDNTNKDVKRTIDYKYSDGKPAQPTVNDSLHFERTVVIDKVTGKVISDTWTPSQDFNDVQTPVIQGYKPDRTVVSDTNIGHDHQDIVEHVVYSPDKQFGHIDYIDNDTKTTLTTDTFSGNPNEHENYKPTDRIHEFENKGYEVVSNDYPDGGFNFDDNDQQEQVFHVHLKHGMVTVTTKKPQTPNTPINPDPQSPKYPEDIDNTNKDVKRTIDYKYSDGKPAQPTVNDSLHFERTVVIDKVTGKVISDTWTPSQDFNDVQTPVIQGYKPDRTVVSDTNIGHDHQDIVEHVVYSPDKQFGHIDYIDNDTKTTLTTDTFSGNPNEHENYKPTDRIHEFENKGYEVVSNDYPDGGFNFDDNDQQEQVFHVHLKHGMVTVTTKKPQTPNTPINPDPQSPKYPEDIDNTNKDVKRTIDYKYSDGKPAQPTVNDSLHFERTVVIDKVTGKVISDTWTPSQDFNDVQTPVIQGYKPDRTVVSDTNIGHDHQDIVEHVVYSPDKQFGHIDYIDNDTKTTLTTDTFSGNPNEHENYKPTDRIHEFENKGYEVVSNDYPDGGFNFDDNDQQEQVFHVHLKHGMVTVTTKKPQTPNTPINPDPQSPKYPEDIDNTNKDVKRTIDYKYSDGKPAQPTVNDSLHFERTVVIDKVTGDVLSDTWTPSQDFNDVQTPVIQGYKPDRTVVSDTNIGHDHQDIVEHVVYSPDKQFGHIDYIDNDTKTTLTTDTFSGNPNEHENYKPTDRIHEFENKGYEVVSNDYPDGGFNFDDNDQQEQVFHVHLKHGMVTVTTKKPQTPNTPINPDPQSPKYPKDINNTNKDVKRTIDYKYSDGKPAQPTVNDSLHFERTVVIDKVTGKVISDTWTPSQDFNDVQTPVIQGYKPDRTVVSDTNIGHDHQDIVEHVVYSPDKQFGHIDYIDNDTKTTLTTDTFSGNPNEHENYKPTDRIHEFENKGYEVVSNDYPDGGFNFDDNDQQEQVFHVHLKHGMVTVTTKKPQTPNTPINPDPQSPKYPKDINNTNKDVKRTIDYKYSDGKPAQPTVNDSLHFERTVVIDKVTGKVISDTWTQNQDFNDIQTPTIQGYTPDRTVVSDKNIDHNHDDIIEHVVYSPDAQTATITYIDDTEKKTLGSDKQNGKFNQVITFEHDPAEVIKGLEERGYKLVSDNFKPGIKYQNDNKSNNFEVHLVHTYEPAETSQTITETVHYIDANGKPVAPDHVATVVVKVTGTRDKVTDSITWNTPSTGHFDEVISPVVPNMTPDKKFIPSRDVQYGDSDITESVVYTSDNPTSKTPEKPDKPSKEVSKTPEKPNKPSKEVSKTPEKPNKPSKEVSKTPEKPNKPSKEVSKIPEKPDKPSKEVSKTPEKPNKPSKEVSKTPEKPNKPSKEVSKIPEKPIDSRTVDNHVSAKSTAKRELPQTGATTNTGIWTGLVSMIASLGLLGASKKRKKN